MRPFAVLTLLVGFTVCPVLPGQAHAADSANVSLDTQSAKPRQVEDSTRTAVTRDYSAAWRAMTQALDQNQPELLAANFVGTAATKLTATISEQQQAGLHQRYIEKGHRLQAIFYSADGSALELHDTVQLQRQLVDGSKVVHSEDVTLNYIAILTAAENSWKVRILQAVPGF